MENYLFWSAIFDVTIINVQSVILVILFWILNLYEKKIFYVEV